jgi:3-oxoacyl-[acyl-carrier protein] reductase
MTRKVCLVAGGSSGIGAATTRLFAKRGWNVAINYAHNAEQAEAVAQACRADGVEAITVEADIGNDAACRTAVAKVEAAWGRRDVLVNSAGITTFVALRDLDGLEIGDFQRLYNTNVVGPFHMTRACAALLREANGAVVNVSSTAGTMGVGSSLAYMASKGALNALTYGLARALGPEVRVNAVAPGLVESDRMRHGLGEAAYETRIAAYKARATLNATLTADEVAEAIWWLGTGATKTTGEVLQLDAGLRLTSA